MNYKRYYKNYDNECLFCGEKSGKYELCKDCYHLAEDEIIIQNENGNWIKNIKKGIEERFYNEDKQYTLNLTPLNEFELNFYNLIRKNIDNKFIIDPQTNLQTIIKTNTNKRNDELFRNIDYVIFEKINYSPILAIELNGLQHKTNAYNQERDKSVQSILKDAQLPLLNIDIKILKKLNYNKEQKLSNIINEVINYTYDGYTELCKKSNNSKTILTWAEKQIKELAK